MKDINLALTKKYFELLNNNIKVNGSNVPVYYKYLPATVNASAYILINSLTSNDTSNKQLNATDTSVQVAIYTKFVNNNDGYAADEIARQVFDIIYPTPTATIDLSPDFQNYSIKLVNDISPDTFQTPSFIMINRFITFRHSILHY